MKKIILSLLLGLFVSTTFAANDVPEQGSVENDSPTSFVDKVVGKANQGGVTTVRTQGVNESFSGNGGVSTTLNNITKSSITSEYINWFGFFALSIAVILIIYNGVLLISSRGNDSVYKKVQTRLVNIVIGIIVIFAAYMIIRLVLSILAGVFK